MDGVRLAQSVLCAHGLDVVAVGSVPVDVDTVVDVSCGRMGLVVGIGASTDGQHVIALPAMNC